MISINKNLILLTLNLMSEFHNIRLHVYTDNLFPPVQHHAATASAEIPIT